MSLPLDRIIDLDRQSLRDRVYDRILDMLLTEQVEPGARLSIDSMAKQLAVSPTPVREAMVQLERTGLVSREALKGYRVAEPLDAQQLAELFDSRQVLELAAVERAWGSGQETIDRLTERQSTHLAEAELVATALERDGVPVELTREYFDADNQFHREIFMHTGNRYLLQMYDSLGALTHRMRQSALRGPQDVREAAQEHQAILDAFTSGDRETAVETMRTHIQNVRGRALAETIDT